MENRAQSLRIAGRLKPLEIRLYAESRGWQPVEGVNGRMWVFRHPTQALRQLQIPMDSDISGFDEAMLDVAARIAELESRDLPAVLADLQHPSADTLRIRVVSAEAAGGDVPLSEDLELREGARRALLAAACSVVNPVKHHPRLSRSAAEQLVKSCLAGQTEHGSYVLTVICPLNAVDEVPIFAGQQEPPEVTDPFVRRTTRLLMEASAGLTNSIEQGRVDEFLHADSEKPIVSWNLCDALLRLQPTGDGKVEISAHWAARPDIPPPPGTLDKVSIPKEYFAEIEKIAGILRPLVAGAQARPFIGTVESLNGVIGDDGRRAGEVVLSIFDEEGEASQARAYLGADDYSQADRAHMQGLGFVRFVGVFRRGLRVGRIEQIRDFALLDEELFGAEAIIPGLIEPDVDDPFVDE